MYIYIYMYIYVYTYMYIHIYICIYIYIYMKADSLTAHGGTFLGAQFQALPRQLRKSAPGQCARPRSADVGPLEVLFNVISARVYAHVYNISIYMYICIYVYTKTCLYIRSFMCR